MRVHKLSETGVILNTIEVDSIDTFESLVESIDGAEIGDSIVDGALIKNGKSVVIPVPENDDDKIKKIEDIEMRRQPKAVREAILNGDKTKLQIINDEIISITLKSER